MQLTTLFGMVIGLVCIGISITIDGQLRWFLDMASVFIVFGGTIAATIASYSMKTLMSLGKVFLAAFQKEKINLYKDIEVIIEIAKLARKDGLISLENMEVDPDNTFLKKGLMLLADGSEPELIRTVLETEIYFIQERHVKGQTVIDSMASYAPAFGLVGTLIGLINMLKKLDDPSGLGPSMAVALITTFYGVVLANLVFNPISKKLKMRTANEYIQKQLYLEGLLSIQNGENPMVIKDKLTAFMSRRELNKVEPKSGMKL